MAGRTGECAKVSAWHEDSIDEEHDPERHYPVDFVLNGSVRPIGIFGVQTVITASFAAPGGSDPGAGDVLDCGPEAHEKTSGKTHAWLTDSVDKQFSTLGGNEEAVVAYVERELDVSRRLTMTAGQ